MKPVIGILYCGFLTQGFERQSIYVTSSYLSAVEVSGGLPVVIPYFSDFNYIANYIKLFDGILFCGGDDVTPLLYHEELGTNRGHTDYKTDTFHFTFMKEALRSRLPNLGICRRKQVLNLELGNRSNRISKSPFYCRRTMASGMYAGRQSNVGNFLLFY